MRKCNYLSMWDELNLKNLLSDATKMDVRNLAKRYQVSDSTILDILKKHSIPPKNPYGFSSKHRTTGNVSCTIDEPFVTASPHNSKYNLYTVNQHWR